MSTPDPEEEGSERPDETQSEEVRHSPASAIVPARVARGTFSTGAVVLQGPHEFVIDFLLRLATPHQVAARVVLAPTVMPGFIQALRQNVANYEKRFGPPPSLPASPPQAEPSAPPTAQELYDNLKLTEDIISGSYANAVMIGHTAAEFSFDFITTFFPRSAVSTRVFLAAANVPRFLDSLTHAFEQAQRKRGAPPEPPRRQPPSPGDNPSDQAPEDSR